MASALRTSFPSKRLRLLLLAGGVLALALLAFAYIELRESRADLLRSSQLEGETLIEAISSGSESAIAAGEELDAMLAERLRASALLVAHRETHARLDAAVLGALRDELSLDVLAIADGALRLQACSDGTPAGALLAPDAQFLAESARNGSEDETAGISALVAGGPEYYLLTVPRLAAAGHVFTGVDAEDLLAFRKKVGIGKLVRELGGNPDIAWAALQDEEGILAASAGVTSLSSIGDDAFLSEAFRSHAPRTRLIDTGAVPVLEVVRALQPSGGPALLTRVGLRLDKVRSIQQRGAQRVALLAGALFAVGVVLLFLLTTRRRFSDLRERHAIVQSTTDLVLENMADAVIATDAAGIVTVFNRAAERLTGLATEQATGRHCRDVCTQDSFLLGRTLASGVPVVYEERELTRSDGAVLSIAVSTSLLRGGDGATDLAIAIARDLTERKRIQERLERRDRLTAMGALASGIAHEIRNPLNAIHMIVQRFRSEFEPREGAEEYRRLADTVRSEVQRVNGIITQFLAFARPPKPDLKPADLADTVRRALDVVASEARSAGIAVRFEGPAGCPCVIDAQRITQALLNLFQNALQAMTPGGTLAVTLRQEPGACVLEVRDSGAGIPPEVLPNIFNLYFTTKSGGSGLGLSIVQQIVAEHGGDVQARSVVGEGSTFIITVPYTN